MAHAAHIRAPLVSMVFGLLAACSNDGVEVTVYPLLCDGPLIAGDCRGKITPMNRTAYKVFPAAQQVVFWTPGISDRPVRLEQCAVRDSENWKCHLPRGEGQVELTNGVFKETLAKPRIVEDRFFYSGAARWWTHHLLLSRL